MHMNVNTTLNFIVLFANLHKLNDPFHVSCLQCRNTSFAIMLESLSDTQGYIELINECLYYCNFVNAMRQFLCKDMNFYFSDAFWSKCCIFISCYQRFGNNDYVFLTKYLDIKHPLSLFEHFFFSYLCYPTAKNR